ncbi:MAG: hypothetical protein ACU841_08620 [Gammaproteobacteria bacterium]
MNFQTAAHPARVQLIKAAGKRITDFVQFGVLKSGLGETVPGSQQSGQPD